MTEQSPSNELIEAAAEYLDDWFGLEQWPPVHKLDILLASFCEQRGAAEAKRVIEIIKAIAKLYVDEVEFDTGWRMACERIMLHIRPEQSPSADGALDDLLPPLDGEFDYKEADPAWKLLYRWHKKYAERSEVSRLFMSPSGAGLITLAEAINALCEQRVSTERERFERIVSAWDPRSGRWSDVCYGNDAIKDMMLHHIASSHDRPPAERPAPAQSKTQWFVDPPRGTKASRVFDEEESAWRYANECPPHTRIVERPVPEGPQLSKHQAAPIPMVLFCPSCGVQHIDKGNWDSPPHRTHQCQGCSHLWRPAAVYTEGVADVPLGTSDVRPAIRERADYREALLTRLREPAMREAIERELSTRLGISYAAWAARAALAAITEKLT